MAARQSPIDFGAGTLCVFDEMRSAASPSLFNRPVRDRRHAEAPIVASTRESCARAEGLAKFVCA